MNDTTITHHYNNQIHFQVQHDKYWKHLARILGYPADGESNIDWKVFNNIQTQSNFNQYIFGVKWRNNCLPVNHMELYVGRVTDASCPSLCGCTDEDHSHLLLCPAHDQKESWTHFFSQMEQVYKSHNIDPGLRRVMTNLLQHLPFTLAPMDLTTTYLNIYETQMRYSF